MKVADDNLRRLATDDRCHDISIHLVGRPPKARLVQSLDVAAVQEHHTLFSSRNHHRAKVTAPPSTNPALDRAHAYVEDLSGLAPQHPFASVAVVEPSWWRHGLNFLPMLAV
jgi:hypothetical protein